MLEYCIASSFSLANPSLNWGDILFSYSDLILRENLKSPCHVSRMVTDRKGDSNKTQHRGQHDGEDQESGKQC